jgi:hypothetical protein
MAAPRSPDFEYAPVPSSTATQEQGKSNTEAKHVLVNTNSVTPSLTEKNGESVTQRPGWTSTYLQNKTLLGFAIAFLCLLLAVIALAVVDAKQDGIANAKSSEHYLWTYGPTAGACPILFYRDICVLTCNSVSHCCCVVESSGAQDQDSDAVGDSSARNHASIQDSFHGLCYPRSTRGSLDFATEVTLARRNCHHELIVDHATHGCVDRSSVFAKYPICAPQLSTKRY